jgi:glutathione S-transferase
VKLYYSAGACSLAAHIVLEETGLSYQAEAVDLRSTPHQTASGQLLTDISPKGYVPILVLDSGAVLTEGVAILQYLADLVPEKDLAAENGSLERYQLQSWLNFIATEIHKGFSPLWASGSSEEGKKLALERLSKRFSLLEQQLAGQDYLMGHFTVADAYLFTCLNWTGFLKVSLQQWPLLQAYMARVADRPFVQAALEAEGLV